MYNLATCFEDIITSSSLRLGNVTYLRSLIFSDIFDKDFIASLNISSDNEPSLFEGGIFSGWYSGLWPPMWPLLPSTFCLFSFSGSSVLLPSSPEVVLSFSSSFSVSSSPPDCDCFSSEGSWLSSLSGCSDWLSCSSWSSSLS